MTDPTSMPFQGEEPRDGDSLYEGRRPVPEPAAGGGGTDQQDAVPADALPPAETETDLLAARVEEARALGRVDCIAHRIATRERFGARIVVQVCARDIARIVDTLPACHEPARLVIACALQHSRAVVRGARTSAGGIVVNMTPPNAAGVSRGCTTTPYGTRGEA